MKKRIQLLKRLNEILPRVDGAKFFIAGALAVTMMASCKKESAVGLEVQPEGDLLHTRVTDTLSITSFILRDDSVKTDELTRQLAGSYNDPVFGYSAASIYSQFRMPTNGPQLGGATLDSIVLSLAYSGTPPYYGSVSDGDMQTFKVYQVVGTMTKEASYYSNQTMDVYPQSIGNATFNPDITDSVLVGDKREKPQLRIKLDPAFGYLLLNAGETNLANNTNFTQYFKGLEIRPETPNQLAGKGAILYFDLLDGSSGLTLYYHTATDTAKYRLQASGGAYFMHFTHTYPSTGPVAQQITTPSQGQNLLYLQAMGGTKAKIMFPHIQHLTDSGKVVINRAELVLKADPSFITTMYPAPDRLFVIPVTSTGANGDLFSFDDFIQGSSYYGGTYDATTKEYHFNVSRYVQSIIDGKATDYGLYLAIAGSGVNGSRLVIGGGSNPAYNLQLRLTYTKLD